MLEARVRVTVGTLKLDVELAVDAGETVVLLGPNGAGKTTLLRALAGLTPIDEGRVALDGVVLDEPETDSWVITERRSIGFVFQDYLLFPHLNAIDNVAFGLRSQGVSRAMAQDAARTRLAEMGLDQHFDARPGALSGGQAQRVALARALILEPKLLLLDEPLAALDTTARSEVRRSLRKELEQFSGARIVVTHDPVDAFALATRVVILEDGAVRQIGTIDDLRAHPRSRFIADFVGVNLYRGVLRGDDFTTAHGTVISVSPDDELSGDVLAMIAPDAVTLHRDQPSGSARNTFQGRVIDVDDQGRRARVTLEVGQDRLVAEITSASRASLAVDVGAEVWASVKATEVSLYAA